MFTSKTINSLAFHITAHWREMNEVPKIDQLILIKGSKYFDSKMGSYFLNDKNEKIPLWVSNDEKFSIGYVEPNKDDENNYYFFPQDFMCLKDRNCLAPFSSLYFEKWIYLNEII